MRARVHVFTGAMKNATGEKKNVGYIRSGEGSRASRRTINATPAQFRRGIMVLNTLLLAPPSRPLPGKSALSPVDRVRP